MLHVSIRRADLGLLERASPAPSSTMTTFQSAGRIWGFWNETRMRERLFAAVSIRRADLGLLELDPWLVRPDAMYRGFNPPGGFGAFGTLSPCLGLSLGAVAGFNPPGGFGAFGTVPLSVLTPHHRNVSIRRADLGLLEHSMAAMRLLQKVSFNPPGGFGAFGTTPSFAW
ncbi:hypothetical protein OSCT_0321 [Oscillochloris trichoides DG-6]|uniref:Uncharacterized protein n=1 Tax=Oscillochloris trichoides DG-6 TaxID=765420 RepID=E1IAH0_9CHLR|nr:hypothetical protein OSCT_0321 [Oscillochloris trichoides DG-6]